MSDLETELRRGIIQAARQMNAIGLNQSTSGKLSARFADRMLITPAGVPYDELEPEDILLPDAEIAQVIERFKDCGPRDREVVGAE